MKWIKASERLPEKEGLYHCKAYSRNSLFTKEEIHSATSGHLENLQWLDESQHPAEQGAIEILKELCQLKHYKDTVGKDFYYEAQQPQLWKKANDYLNSLVKKSQPEGSEPTAAELPYKKEFEEYLKTYYPHLASEPVVQHQQDELWEGFARLVKDLTDFDIKKRATSFSIIKTEYLLIKKEK